MSESRMTLKLLLIVIDGMGDLPSPILGGRTPLEFAKTPNMDSFAKRGQTGMMYTVKKGIAPESHTGVISVLGYDPFKYEADRGILEAVGTGMSFEDGDLALRCNFITLGEDMHIIDRRVGRNLTTDEARLLSSEINKKVRLDSYPADFEFRSTIGYRGVLVIRTRSDSLSKNITNTDPAYQQEGSVTIAKSDFEMVALKSNPLNNTESARASAGLVNEFSKKSHEILERSEVNEKRAKAGKLKANYLLMRDGGDRLPRFFNINQEYGVRFASLVNMPVEKGIAKLTGMEGIEIPPPSADLAKDCRLVLDKLLNHLKDYDGFYVHIKGPDEPGHDGDCDKKARLLEVIDKHFFGNLEKKLDLNNILLCITADHATPCVAKAHTGDPVPILISGQSIVADGSRDFSEKVCKNGSLGIIEKGTELMPRLLALMKR
jgi:2,3-bisphosphoglycerate-independent phosphoglycerate mutase